MSPSKERWDARRQDVSAAVWRVMATRGFAGLTLRAVATEMGASTGLLTHYFPNKRALVVYALDILGERTHGRLRQVPPAPGLAALRTALIDILPLTPDGTANNRIWVASWDVALADAELGADQAARYEVIRAKLHEHIAVAQERGELPGRDGDDLAAAAIAFTHGVVVQTLFDPAAFPPKRQVALVDHFLASLAQS
jgi:AcrR family transcriptional regulator